ncbi:MAG: alpha/beta hydrolase [Polyangiales bacterium]
MRISPAFWALILTLGCGGGSSAIEESPTDGSPSDGTFDDSAGEGDDAAGETSPSETSVSETSVTSDSGPTIDPSAKGPFDVVVSETKVGTNNAHLIAPKGAPPPSGWPAVVFAHGFQLATNNYDDILKHVASHGFVVLSVDYPGSLFSIDHRDVRDAIVNGRAALVANMVTGAPKVDPTKTASMGHSLGGKGAVWATIAEKAFTAGLALDPVDGNPSPGGMASDKTPVLAPTETAKLTQPIGYFGATQSHCAKPGPFSQACAPEALDAAHFFAGTPGTKYLWTVFDFGHMQFLDNAMCGFTCDSCVAGKSDPAPRKTAIKAVSVSFLRRHVLGEADYQKWLDGSELDKDVTAKLIWDGKTAKPACP